MRHYFLAAALVALALFAAFGASRYRRLHAYDDLILQVAGEYGLPPALVRAVIWRESRFRYNARGSRGEIGLMQVTENAGREWAQAAGQSGFSRNDLFNPEINIRAGSWYLKRSLGRWEVKTNALPYALAEYNAGRSNAVRWATGDNGDANRFRDAITYPATRRYVSDVLGRFRRERK